MKNKAPTPTNTLVAIPSMGNVRAELMAWVVENNFKFITSIGVTPHSAARNYLFQQFLMHEYEYLLMIDSDTVPFPDSFKFISYLIKNGADVATGVTPIIKANKLCVNVYQQTKDVEKCTCWCEIPEEPFEVSGCGMSYVLMTKDIIQRVNQITHGHPCRSIEFEDGKRCSEDLFFCDKVREIGGTIVAHPMAECIHYKTIPLMFECSD